MTKKRLDVLLVERGLAESRSQAQRMVMAGQVRVNGEVVLRSAANVAQDVRLDVDRGPRFVSRGGEKLDAALLAFKLEVKGLTCADVGASTGGFTDCLLQHEAEKVYAIDVGQGILDWKLRNDKRVVVMEDINARYVKYLPEPVDFITMDASFISLKILLPVVKQWFTSPPDEAVAGTVVALIKPQFEAGYKQVGRGKGVIRDPAIHRQVLLEVLEYALQLGYTVHGLMRSPLTGPKGNVEFLTWLEVAGGQSVALPELVDGVLLGEAHSSTALYGRE